MWPKSGQERSESGHERPKSSQEYPKRGRDGSRAAKSTPTRERPRAWSSPGVLRDAGHDESDDDGEDDDDEHGEADDDAVG